jgi:hypothetical protein
MRQSTHDLRGVLDNLIAALSQGDSASAIFDKDLRFTVNSKRHELGSLLSKTSRPDYEYLLSDQTTRPFFPGHVPPIGSHRRS